MSDSTKQLPACAIDRQGWWAIQHTDGWWLGTEKGVLCYEEEEIAKMALTIRWQMDGGGPVRYKIKLWPGHTEPGNELENKKTAEQAITDYEKRAPRRIK